MPPTSPDLWEWVVVYRDGTHLAENGGGDAPCLANPAHGDEQAHGGVCVRLDESVAGFYLRPLREGLSFIALSAPVGARPIIFRRRPAYDALRDGAVTPAASITVVGWQMTVGGRNVKYMLAANPDGSVSASDDDAVFEVPMQQGRE